MFDLSFASKHSDIENQKTQLSIAESKQFNGKMFENIGQVESKPDYWAMIKMYMFDKQKPAVPPEPIEVEAITKTQLLELQKNQGQGLSFFRLGHSTLLILLDGEFWLTDPVFSERASPFQFVGPKRFHQPPISIDELPDIKGVILSHNHYDHLDKAAIEQLKHKVEHFYTPLGVGEELINWGVARQKITQLDWWQSITVNQTTLTATPSQHFSGRAFSDRNQSLWSSWAVKAEHGSFFFSGDTGYFDQFAKIGEKLGPFDFSFMETGAYNQLWSEIHMHPQQSAQAHLDVRAKYMVPIHNGTFDLSTHTWTDPFERISEWAGKLNIALITPKMGQLVQQQVLDTSGEKSERWWQVIAVK
ncbi:MAG: outer membrane protein RomA [Osedax symbiont Rs2]|nr:MAG: outer membrane protein RomA [Osedax symbiont Rs2]